jgi:glycosyltransferase involved in cell wall biosynthesis
MPEVCLVIPCFNEAARLRSDEIVKLVDRDPSASVCLVNDGSADRTADVLAGLERERPGRVFVLSLAHNCGKAEAVRQGVNHAVKTRRPAYVGYWDADLSTPLTELPHLVAALLDHPCCVMVLGSRVKRLGSFIDRRTIRHLLGRVFSTCASAILSISVYDSQCGAKIFRSEAAERLFADPFVTRWCFDLELLVRLRNQVGAEGARTAAIEVPLTEWREVAGSKLGFGQMLPIPMDLLRIRSHYNSRSKK